MLAGAVVVDLGDAVANGVAAFAAVVSVIALFVADSRAKEANSIAVDANKTSREARDIAEKANDIALNQYNLAVNQHTRSQQQKYRVALQPMLRKLSEAHKHLKNNNRSNDELASIPLAEALVLYSEVAPLLSKSQAGKVGPAGTALRYAMRQWLDLRTARKIRESIPLDHPMDWSKTANGQEILIDQLFRLALAQYHLALMESSADDNYMQCDFAGMREVLDATYAAQEEYLRLNPKAANGDMILGKNKGGHPDVDFGPYAA